MICPHCRNVISVNKTPKYALSTDWRDIKNYEGVYQVSNRGEIRRLYATKIKPLKTFKNTNGYQTVRLYQFHVGHTFNVHRIVAGAFLDNPKNLATVNHKNGNKSDNRVSNLEWSSYSDNHKHAYRELGRKLSGSVANKAL